MVTTQTTIAPPPPGFTLDTPISGSVPAPPSGFTLDSAPQPQPVSQGTPIRDTSTIGPIAKTDWSGSAPLSDFVNKKLEDLEALLPANSNAQSTLDAIRQAIPRQHPDVPKTAENPEGILYAQPLMPLGGLAKEGVSEVVGEEINAAKLAQKAKEAKATKEAGEAGNQLLKTRPRDFRNDVVPGRAIATENVDPDLVESANHARVAKDTVAERQHMEAIQKHLEDSIANLKEQQVTLLKHPSGVDFDLRPIVEDSYKKALAEAQKTGSPEIVKAVNKAHEEMLKIPNGDGELIADRYLTQSADESSEAMQQTKKDFQGRSNYNATVGNKPDTPQLYANNLWKDVAAKVRLQLEDQVPGLGDVNMRIRDARAAADLAKNRVNTLRGMPPLPSKMDRFLKVAKPAVIKGAAYAAGGGAVYDLYRKFLSGE